MQSRIEILKKIDDIKDHHCESCQIEITSNTYCILSCSHGKELVRLGDQLTDLTKKKRLNKQKNNHYPVKPIKAKRSEVKMVEELTKEKYLELKERNLPDTKIITMFLLNNASFYRLKKQWGLKGVKKAKVSAPVPKVEKSTEVSKTEPLQNEVKKLSDTIKEKQFALNAAIGASEKLIEENERLTKENEFLSYRLKEISEISDPIISDLKKRNNALRECLKMVL